MSPKINTWKKSSLILKNPHLTAVQVIYFHNTTIANVEFIKILLTQGRALKAYNYSSTNLITTSISNIHLRGDSNMQEYNI